jgi:hypothetical protein
MSGRGMDRLEKARATMIPNAFTVLSAERAFTTAFCTFSSMICMLHCIFRTFRWHSSWLAYEQPNVDHPIRPSLCCLNDHTP